MADIGLDFAGRPPGAANVKAAGYQFVARYLSRYTAKVITAAEYQDYMNNGVNVVVVFEDYTNQVLKGYNQGVSDAQFALNQARSIGWPDNRPIYFAVDFDISDAQKPTMGEYFKGVHSVIGLGRTGGYGGYWAIKALFDVNFISFGWQAVAWSGGNREARAHLFQRLGGVTVNGTSCDVNDALKTDYGQSAKGGSMATDALTKEEIILSYSQQYDVPEDQVNMDVVRAFTGKPLGEYLRFVQQDPSYIAHFKAVNNPPAPQVNAQIVKDYVNKNLQ